MWIVAEVLFNFKRLPMIFKKNINFIYLFFVLLISFLANQYYAYLGVFPIDTFLIFNSGYDLLNGVLPFKDVWTIKGPFIDLVQAIFFKIFGVSWFSYSSHASLFNSIFALSTFWTLKKFELDLKYCFLYSILASLLMYPTYGIPFSDHHVSILSLLSMYSFLLAIKTKESFYWAFIPILLFLAFFSKQVPASYFLILISLISIFYFYFNFNLKNIFLIIVSSLTIVTVFFSIVFIAKIPISSIIEQYFLFPISLGETRTEWVFPLEFKRVVWRHKLIYISLAIPIYILIKNFKSSNKIFQNENFIILTLIGTLTIFVFHQLMTINGLFIFFLIPIFCGFSHCFSKKYFKTNNLIIYFLVSLSFISTIYYQEKYISKRDTLLLRNVDLSKAVDAGMIDPKLKKLKWITNFYPDNPKEEISNLLEVLNILKKDKRNKMLVTDYQFITVILSMEDYAVSRFWWGHHGYPDKNNKYFNVWKKFLISKIKENNIEVIYTIVPMAGEQDILINTINNNCYSMRKIKNYLNLQVLKSCKELD